MFHRTRIFWPASAVLLLASILSVHAAEIRVDSLADSGAGSLRAAVAGAANGDVIVLRAEGTLTLATPIAIRRSLTITGAGGPLAHTIAGAGGNRLFEVDAGTAVTLSKLTLRGGSTTGDGGAIRSAAALTLDNLILADNTATGLGGAVYQSGGSLTVNRCHFTGNTAGGGGGLAASGASLAVGSSGFGGNAAATGGGGIQVSGTNPDIRNSNFFNNLATDGGGLFVSGGSVTAVNLTLAGNSSHIATGIDGSVVLHNSLVEGEGPALPGMSGSVTDGRNNLAGSAEALGLGRLGDYGGISPSFPLRPGSPAIDAGDSALAWGRDQRGLARFSDGNGDGAGDAVDIGAFEVQHYRVTALQIRGSATGGVDDQGFGNPFDPSDDADSIASADVFVKLSDTGKADIGDAVGANNAAGGGAISFDGLIVPGLIALKGSELEARRDLAVYGPGATRMAINGDGRSRILKVSGGAQVWIQGVALENGSADNGGALLVETGASLELEAVSVAGNRAAQSGGGLAVTGGNAQVYRSSLLNNTAGQQGGGVYAMAGTAVFIDNSTLSYNQAGGPGGAVAAHGFLSLESSTLVGNSSGGATPGLLLDSGDNGSLWNSVFVHGGTSAVAVSGGGLVVNSGYNLSDAAEPALPADAYRQVSAAPVAALGLNGGTTLSHAPVAPGPAINAGDNGDRLPGDPDQPGFPRIRGGAIDIGSVEFQNDPPEIDCAAQTFADCVTAAGTTVAVSVTVFDDDNDDVTVTWIATRASDGSVIASVSEDVSGTAAGVELTQSFDFPLGESTVRIVASDAYAAAQACTVPVSVRDLVAPVVTLAGDALVTLECGVDSYTEAGASAFDACEGALPVGEPELVELPPLGPKSVRTYKLVYRAADSNGNTGAAERVVDIVDTTAPVITLAGEATVTVECGQAYVEPGAGAIDGCQGAVAVGVSSDLPVGGLPAGSYTVTYTATDAAGNTATAYRTVSVVDTTAPVFDFLLDDVVVETDAAYCSALVNLSVTAADSCADAVITYDILPMAVYPSTGEELPNEAYPQGMAITSAHRFPPLKGIPGSEDAWLAHQVRYTATDASGNAVSEVILVTVKDTFLNCLYNIAWPYALPLEVDQTRPDGVTRFGEVRQFLGLTDQARWYRFSVRPGSRVTVVLTELPANYDIVIYKDIQAEYQRILDLFNSPDPDLQNLSLLGVEFAPEVFSPEVFSPEVFSPEVFSPEVFSPEAFSPEVFSPEVFSPEVFSPEVFSPEVFSPEVFSPEVFSPEVFSPEVFSPEVFSPEVFSPEVFSPEVFSPEVFSPETFSSAQVSSMIAYSAFPGVASEGVALNTYTQSGNFYVRVRGANGAFSTDLPFKLIVMVEPEICADVAGPESLSASTLPAPAMTGRKTLILWDSTRMAGDADFVSQLQSFAARPDVMGAVIDVSDEIRVVEANQQADDNPGCPFAKNLVAGEIKAVIDAWWTANPGLEHIVLLGSDDDIPFFRTTDEALLANEANYIPPVRDNTHSQSSLRYGQVLTQDPYGSSCELQLATGSYPFPNLAVGRLVESPADIVYQLGNYAAINGVIEPRSAFVSGYDFLDDVARAVQYELEQAVGGPINTLIEPSTTAPVNSWTAAELAEAWLGSRHDLVFLAGHFSTGSSLAADYETRLTAAQVLASNADLLNTLVFSAGCHSGYNTVDADAIAGVTKQPDWAQAFAKMGATLIAGTGYQYGDTEFIEYSERLYLEFARQLRAGSAGDAIAVGAALNAAKRRYLAETPLMRGIHEKSLVQATLFGLPMLKVRVPGERIGIATTGVRPDGWTEPALAAAPGPGNALGLRTADVAIAPMGPAIDPNDPADAGRTGLKERQLTLKVAGTAGDTVTARWFEGRDGIVSLPAEPTRPLESYLVSVPGTVLRGAGFLGGSYTDIQEFLPLTGAPTTEIRGVHGNFYSDVFYPVQPYSLNFLGAVCGGTDGEQLNLYPAQFLGDQTGLSGGRGTLRKFDDMRFRLYYNNYTGTVQVAGTGDVLIPALAPAPSIARVSSAIAGDTAEFAITVLGSPVAGIHEVWITYTEWNPASAGGEWKSLFLTQDGVDSTLWKGSLPLNGVYPDDIRFMVQAASGTGLVALKTNVGYYYQVGIDDSAQRTPTRVTGLSSPPAAAYGEAPPVSARLEFLADADTETWEPLAGKRVGFRVGTSNASALTAADGTVSLNLPLTTRPGQDLLLQAYFSGDPEYGPSAANALVDLAKQTTRLEFINPPAANVPAVGSDIVVALSDGIGTPLKERTVFFLVTYANGLRIGNAVITDFLGRADLSEVFLPAGSATVTAYFNDITLPDGGTVQISDALYEPAAPVSIPVTLDELSDEDSLAFDPQQVDIYYKSSGGSRRTAGAPVYANASVAGDVAFNVPLQPGDLLLGDADPGFIEARVEAVLAGQVIAAETVLLDTRGKSGNYWTTAARPGAEVSFVGIHWRDAPRFDSALSGSPGPRIYTNFIGGGFSQIRYEPVAGTYSTAFPNGIAVQVKNGVVTGVTGLSTADYSTDAQGVTLDVKVAVAPGMQFVTSGNGAAATTVVTVEAGVNYLLEGGRMIVRLAAIDTTPRPASDAAPNLFECRIILGNDGQVQVRSTARIGEGLNAVPWSSEDPGHKQYRP